jgi:hypothetical protein
MTMLAHHTGSKHADKQAHKDQSAQAFVSLLPGLGVNFIYFSLQHPFGNSILPSFSIFSAQSST